MVLLRSLLSEATDMGLRVPFDLPTSDTKAIK